MSDAAYGDPHRSMRSVGATHMPRGGFQSVEAHPGDCVDGSIDNVATDCTDDSCSEATSESEVDRSVPPSLSIMRLWGTNGQWRRWRHCWCVILLCHPRAALQSSSGRRLLLRILGVAALCAVAVVVWATLGKVKPEIAYRVAGGCLGLAIGLLRLPGSSSEALHGWRRLAASMMIGFISTAIGLGPFLLLQQADDKYGLEKCVVNLLAMLAMMPIVICSVIKRHPPSTYIRDAIWCVFGLWIMLSLWGLGGIVVNMTSREHRVQMRFLFFTMSYNLEGVVFVWIVQLMLSRMCAIESASFFASGSARPIIAVMCAIFPVKMGSEMLLPIFVNIAWEEIYTALTILFLGVWLFYSGVLAASLMRAVKLLRAEAERTRDAAQVEALWAVRILGIELVACITLAFTTTATWVTKLTYVYYKYGDMGDAVVSDRLLLAVMGAHRCDIVLNAMSVGVLSGLLWQPPRPAESDDAARRSPATRDESSGGVSPITRRAGPEFREIWLAKVNELAHRGVRLCDLLTFWERLLTNEVMPHFDPRRSTTNDVVRQAVIPLSREQSPAGGGRALASVWCETGLMARCMVTHNWSNLFWHLVAAIVADQLECNTYADVAEDLLKVSQLRKLRQTLASKGVLDMTFWICAFAINQHAGICSGFGNEPTPGTQEHTEWESKRNDTVTGEPFLACACGQRKIFNDEPASCEMNKFDDMMRLLWKQQVGSFRHLIVVDAEFDVFRRAWCVAEIVESDRSGITQKIKVHSQEKLDKHYGSLLCLDVRDCQASRLEDKEMILREIGDEEAIEAFNARLAWAIFGTEGLFKQWYDGQQRASLVGRMLQRARSAKLERSHSQLQQLAGVQAQKPERKDCRMAASSPFRWLESLRRSLTGGVEMSSDESDFSSDEDTCEERGSAV